MTEHQGYLHENPPEFDRDAQGLLLDKGIDIIRQATGAAPVGYPANRRSTPLQGPGKLNVWRVVSHGPPTAKLPSVIFSHPRNHEST